MFSQCGLSDSMFCTGTLGGQLRAFAPSVCEENEHPMVTRCDVLTGNGFVCGKVNKYTFG